MIKGVSSNAASARLVTEFWKLAVHHEANIWMDRVSSEGNPTPLAHCPHVVVFDAPRPKSFRPQPLRAPLDGALAGVLRVRVNL